MSEEPGYGLLMPFVVCASQGGPYADQPFVSGYRLGRLDAQLEYEKPSVWEGYIAPADVPQVDLIAMRYGYGVETEPHDDDWTRVVLAHAPVADVVTSRFEMPPEWKGNPPSASLDPAPAPPSPATVMCDERHPGFREGDPLGRPCVECLADVKTQEGLGCPGRDNDRRTLTLELPPWLVIDGPVHSVAVLTDRGWYWLSGSPEAVSAASQASTPPEAPDA